MLIQLESDVVCLHNRRPYFIQHSNSMLRKIVFISGMLLATSTATAGEWSGQGEAGYMRASGNTQSETINLGLNFLWEGSVWSSEFDLAVYQSSSDGLDSADSLEAAYTLERSLSERSNLFMSLSYLDDQFDGFTEQSSISAGYSYKLIDRESTTWETGIGIGYRDTEEIILAADPALAPTVIDISGATGVLRSKFNTDLTDNSKFKWNIKTEIGSDNTYAQSDAALLVAMNSRFSLKAQVIVRHNTDPAPTSKKTDTVSLLSLVYNFGERPKAEE